MFRSLLAPILSFAIIAAAPATPVQADAKDVAKVLGGIAAIYVLKEALERQQDRQQSRQAEPVRRAPVHQPTHYSHSHSGLGAHSHRHGTDHGTLHDWSPRPDPRPDVTVRLLPEQCLRQYDARDGLVTGYGAQCMQNSVVLPGSLPPDCLRRLDTTVGARSIYAPRCMGRNGWSTRTARR